jgi:F420H(2)-dependent quinone reductase
MTAVPKAAPRTPPRALVRVFWMVHRAIYRLTGGCWGVWRPKSGSCFGTMRLSAIG